MSKKQKLDWLWIFAANEDVRLSLGARSLYLRIFSLSNIGKKGFCYPGNKKLSLEYKKNSSTISRWISELVKLGYLKRQMIDEPWGSKRILTPIPPPLISKTTIGTDAKTPIAIDEDTLTQEEQEAIDPVALSSERKEEEGQLNDEKQSKEERSNEQIATKIEAKNSEQSIVFGNKQLEERPEEINSEAQSESDSEKPPSPSTLANAQALLHSGRKLINMTSIEQVTMILRFSLCIGDVMMSPALQREKITKVLNKKGIVAEDIIHALWHLKVGEFGYEYNSKLNFLLGTSVEVMKKRLMNALDDFVMCDCDDSLIEIARPFSAILEKPLAGVELVSTQ